MLIYQGSFTVFSTYVEVILLFERSSQSVAGVLHVCGGDPMCLALPKARIKCSPRMWRWSWVWMELIFQAIVFSTYVEVILSVIIFNYLPYRVLHVCGGDPWQAVVHTYGIMCSPRMWRWSYQTLTNLSWLSVFSTYVEVILQNTLYDWLW